MNEKERKKPDIMSLWLDYLIYLDSEEEFKKAKKEQDPEKLVKVGKDFLKRLDETLKRTANAVGIDPKLVDSALKGDEKATKELETKAEEFAPISELHDNIKYLLERRREVIETLKNLQQKGFEIRKKEKR
jgi:kynurenine formamidase